MEKLPVLVPEPGWDAEKPRTFFGIPYSLPETAAWLVNNLSGPSNRYRGLTHCIPNATRLNPLSTPVLRLAFVGDILPLYETRLRVDPGLRDFFSDADLLVGNFEGTIVPPEEKGVFMAQRHSEAVLDFLAGVFPPERTILSCANNHAGDFGWGRFCQSYELLQKHGFHPIGRRDEPSITINNQVRIASATCWSNQRCDYVARFEDLETFGSAPAQAPFNLLVVHWGDELHRFPGPRQIGLGRVLLNKWDAVIGHHPHCPQPVSAYEVDGQKRLAAYSLGDFAFGKRLRKYLTGLAVKITVGIDPSGRWAVGDVNWRQTRIDFIDRQAAVARADWIVY